MASPFGAATPTTVRATAQNRNAYSLALKLQGINEQTVQLSYLVPADDNVRLVSTVTAGTVTFDIISQVEVTIN